MILGASRKRTALMLGASRKRTALMLGASRKRTALQFLFSGGAGISPALSR